MEKNVLYVFIFAIILFLILTVVFIVNINISMKNDLAIEKFNREYEEYNKDNLNGLDITTVMNKAVSNNEKFNIEKDKNGYYLDDENRIEVSVIFNGTPYIMERINKVGIESFIQNFGSASFSCKEIKYHKSGKISELIFEADKY